MKKNKVLLLGIITVFVAIFSLTLVSGTWAKYTSEVSGTSTATVAKWAWKVDSTKVVGDGTTATSFNVNLFKTIKEEDTTTEETDVKNGLIAPGTGGQLSFTVENASEVSGKVVLKFEESENFSSIPLEYSVDGITWTTAAAFSALAGNTAELKLGGTAPLTKEFKIYWRWAFTGDDAKDTGLGNATTAPTITVKVTLTFTQIN